jgi:hypothetical protein
MAHRFLISHDSPVLYITLVTNHRLPVFRTAKLRELVCRAIDEARTTARFLLFGYVMLEHQTRDRNYRYSLWQTEKNVFEIYSEKMFMEKLSYIHQNPVRAGLAERATDWRWSSARIWKGCPVEDEPLQVDKDLIHWRRK